MDAQKAMEPYRDAAPALVEKLEREKRELELHVKNLRERLAHEHDERRNEALDVYKAIGAIQTTGSVVAYMIMSSVTSTSAANITFNPSAHPNIIYFLVALNLLLLSIVYVARKLGD